MKIKKDYNSEPKTQLIDDVEIPESVEIDTVIESEVVFEIKDGYVVGCTSLYVRMGSHTNATPIDTIQSGEKITVIDEENDFYKIQTNTGIEGFAMKKYIKLV